MVDDEAVVRRLIHRAFGAEGYRVVEAETAGQGQELFRSSRPDVAVIDYMLADGDGMDLLRSLRAMDSGTPIVILTGHGSIDLAVQAMREGADDFITKPVELPALVLIVQRSVENSPQPAADAGPEVAAVTAQPPIHSWATARRCARWRRGHAA